MNVLILAQNIVVVAEILVFSKWMNVKFTELDTFFLFCKAQIICSLV